MKFITFQSTQKVSEDSDKRGTEVCRIKKIDMINYYNNYSRNGLLQFPAIKHFYHMACQCNQRTPYNYPLFSININHNDSIYRHYANSRQPKMTQLISITHVNINAN